VVGYDHDDHRCEREVECDEVVTSVEC
jgi:hypothetical protein